MASDGAAARIFAEAKNEARIMPVPVLILIPTYGSAEKLRVCLESLSRHLPGSGCATYVLDDATPDSSVKEVCEEAKRVFPELRYVRSEVNRGFVGTCNWGRTELLEPEHDLLLLNSDTEVTAGFLLEMQGVLHLHEKHAVVTPRSNNATIFSIPASGERLAPSESYALWQRLSALLPAYQRMPTAVGFCMLIKAQVLDYFGLFDEVYSPGYNEENDFVRRINRYGYSAVAANRAYVFHHESASFGPRRAALEASHRQILLERYPEYERTVSEYAQFHVDPVDVFAELWLPHRPRILFDLFHLEAKHSGTSEFALNLLREVYRLTGKEFDLHIGINRSALAFFSAELRGYKIYEDLSTSRMTFDLLYKPCQVFTWVDFARMTRLSARIAYTLQDIIGVRCEYLSGANREILFKKTAELADRVFTISNFSRDDFHALYNSEVPMQVIYHGTNVGTTEGEFRAGEYVLVMGNAFAHKGISDALENLDVDRPVLVLGGKDVRCKLPRNTRILESGSRSRQQMRDLLARARLLVYPSHYEGFGLPVVDALALGKPVIVLESAVNRELASLVEDSNLHPITSLQQLSETVEALFRQTPDSHASKSRAKEPRRWRAAGEEYLAAWRELLERDIDVGKLRKRFETVRMIQSVGG